MYVRTYSYNLTIIKVIKINVWDETCTKILARLWFLFYIKYRTQCIANTLVGRYLLISTNTDMSSPRILNEVPAYANCDWVRTYSRREKSTYAHNTIVYCGYSEWNQQTIFAIIKSASIDIGGLRRKRSGARARTVNAVCARFINTYPRHFEMFRAQSRMRGDVSRVCPFKLLFGLLAVPNIGEVNIGLFIYLSRS